MLRLAADRRSVAFVRPRSRGRLEPGSSVEAIEEVIGAAAITGAATHIIHVHMFGLSDTLEVLKMIDGAVARGLDITADAASVSLLRRGHQQGKQVLRSRLARASWVRLCGSSRWRSAPHEGAIRHVARVGGPTRARSRAGCRKKWWTRQFCIPES